MRPKRPVRLDPVITETTNRQRTENPKKTSEISVFSDDDFDDDDLAVVHHSPKTTTHRIRQLSISDKELDFTETDDSYDESDPFHSSDSYDDTEEMDITAISSSSRLPSLSASATIHTFASPRALNIPSITKVTHASLENVPMLPASHVIPSKTNEPTCDGYCRNPAAIRAAVRDTVSEGPTDTYFSKLFAALNLLQGFRYECPECAALSVSVSNRLREFLNYMRFVEKCESSDGTEDLSDYLVGSHVRRGPIVSGKKMGAHVDMSTVTVIDGIPRCAVPLLTKQDDASYALAYANNDVKGINDLELTRTSELPRGEWCDFCGDEEPGAAKNCVCFD